LNKNQLGADIRRAIRFDVDAAIAANRRHVNAIPETFEQVSDEDLELSPRQRQDLLWPLIKREAVASRPE
jgi:hypothetical protein